MIAGVVLAAGRSVRLGQPKQLLPYRGRPLLAWALAAMAGSRVDRTIVVVGHEAERVRREVGLPGPGQRIDAEVEVVDNPRYAEGLSTSLQAALAALATDVRVQAAVVTVGDQPLLRAAFVDALIDAHLEAGAPIVAADYGDHRGTPLLLHRSVWSLAREIHGDQGARALLHAYPAEVATVLVPPASAADVDTWEDYQRLRGDE